MTILTFSPRPTTPRPAARASGAATAPSSGHRRALDILAIHHLPVQTALSAVQLTADRRLVLEWPRDRGLAARAWHVLAQTAWTGSPIRYLGTMPLFDGHRVYTDEGADWVLLYLADESAPGDRRGAPVPIQVLADLRRARRSIDFDALYVAYQVPPDDVRESSSGRPRSPEPPRRIHASHGVDGRSDRALWTIGAVVASCARAAPGELAAWFALGR